MPGTDDYLLYPDTSHSIDLNTEVFIPEWNRSILMKLENDTFSDEETMEYIDGRAEEFYLIPRQR